MIITHWKKRVFCLFTVGAALLSAMSAGSGRIRRDGPEDLHFDRARLLPGMQHFAESVFTKGSAGVPGRKPTPDGLSVTPSGEKIYWEDKRPSECASNSWLSTYPRDPFAEYRLSQAEACRAGRIPRALAEARIIIREHDDHLEKRLTRWNDPPGLPANLKVVPGIRLPSAESDRVRAIVEELSATGRDPQVGEHDGVTVIRFSPRS